jgi:hypothetical protein
MKNEIKILDENTTAVIIKSNKYGILECLVDSEDLPRVSAFTTWGVGSSRIPYIYSHVPNSGKIAIHQLILSFPEGLVVDHINGDVLDNRKSNLRICSSKDNSRNRKLSRNSSSGYKGVRKKKGKFLSYIYHNYSQLHLGSFDTLEEAAVAYDRAARKYHGEFAATNFPA